MSAGPTTRPCSSGPRRADTLIWSSSCCKYGAGIHHELPIKGWGEKGSTSLQVAVAPGWSEEEQPKKHEVARILIEDGAYYDVYSACGLNDTDRLRELIDEDAEVVDATDDYGMTPLHWAAAQAPCSAPRCSWKAEHSSTR